MADDLKRSRIYSRIKPGGETADFLDKIMSLITSGSLFLAAISVSIAVIVVLMNIRKGGLYFMVVPHC